jgi:hypothetical protein
MMAQMTYSDWQKQHPMRVMCGGCKATGLKHAWTKDADLKPVEPREPCPSCNGSGWSARSA